jgi:AAA+ superfamily predicted ATPase
MIPSAYGALRPELDEVRSALERLRARGPSIDVARLVIARDTPDGADTAPTIETPLGILARAFNLSAFERAVLALTAGVELDPAIAELAAPAPTFGLACAALDGAHWTALMPDAPLRRWRLVQVGAGASILQAPLRLDERILHHLAGLAYIDERLINCAESLEAPDAIPPSHVALARHVRERWRGRAVPLPVVQLTGADPAATRMIAAAACAMLGLRSLAIAPEALPAAGEELETLMRLAEREAALLPCALFIDVTDLEAEDPRTAVVRRFVDRSSAPILLGVRDRWYDGPRDSATMEVTRASAEERRTVWRLALGEAASALNGDLERMADHFELAPGAIQGLVRGVAGEHQGPVSADALWAAGRAATRPRLQSLATRIESTVGWDDLILPEAQRDALRAIVAEVRQRTRVYGEWGFARRRVAGLGTTALFSGASGTGKTLAAAVLANELRLDLYHVDLSQVVSKYIGETEKNLRRVFDGAERGSAVLLFDEADALFGKRSEVRDSHDRYANIEVSYLLQRLEAYRGGGLAILTTNARDALDAAFMRRIRFIVTFPFPERHHREAMWRRAFPETTPVDALDFDRLARLNVVGSSIHNIALAAAFLAADAGQPIRMEHILRAARAEFMKLDRSLTELEAVA